jgi:hypothetical protein
LAAYVQDRDSYGGAIGETWALWRELAVIDWEEEGKEIIWERPPRGWHDADPKDGWRRERRRDYLVDGWPDLIQRMASLAEQYSAENVRLSVWFDWL